MASKKSAKIVNPAASDASLTKSPMPFSSTPFTTYNNQQVQPKTTPALRQLSADKNVIVHNKSVWL